MSKRESLLRCLLIIKKLRSSKQATFTEIGELLKYESELQGYNFIVSKRTFQRDLDDIRSIFDIDIQFCFSRKVYFIAEEAQPDSYRTRLLEAIDMLHGLQVAGNLSQYIILEKRRPLGTEHIPVLLNAAQNQYVVEFTHQKHWDTTPTKRTVAPYALKEFKGRWYLLALDQKDSKLKTFGLDRITDIAVSGRKFKNKLTVNDTQLFGNFFGIINPDNVSPEEVILSFTHQQGQYVKSFPLHASQQVISEDEDEVKIKLRLAVTYDFVMELLSYGAEVTVLEPDTLKQELAEVYTSALEKYGKTIT